jgi:hypothetical protein
MTAFRLPLGKNKRGYMHCVAKILLARSASLRAGLRRKEGIFGGPFTADLKVCSTHR